MEDEKVSFILVLCLNTFHFSANWRVYFGTPSNAWLTEPENQKLVKVPGRRGAGCLRDATLPPNTASDSWKPGFTPKPGGARRCPLSHPQS